MMQEMYADIKIKRWARIYTPMVMLRRTLYVLAIIVFPEIGRDGLFIWLFVIQAGYLTLFLVIRPYNKVYMNLLECTNEVYFSALIIIFFVLNNDKKWTDSRSNTVLTLLMSNSIVVLAIMLGFVAF